MEHSYLDFPFEVKAESVTDAGTFKGIASTFGGAPDAGGDIVEEGAFTETIAKGGEYGNGIAMLYQHDSHDPIGVWTSMQETKRGLIVEGELALPATRAQDAYILLRKGALRGLSIGYRVHDHEVDEKRKIRKLKKIGLWEVSLVTFPMNARARVTAVKAIEEARTERELEHALREAGLSKAAALYVVKLARPSLREASGETAGAIEGDAFMQTVLDGLRAVNARNDVWRRLQAN